MVIPLWQPNKKFHRCKIGKWFGVFFCYHSPVSGSVFSILLREHSITSMWTRRGGRWSKNANYWSKKRTKLFPRNYWQFSKSFACNMDYWNELQDVKFENEKWNNILLQLTLRITWSLNYRWQNRFRLNWIKKATYLCMEATKNIVEK